MTIIKKDIEDILTFWKLKFPLEPVSQCQTDEIILKAVKTPIQTGLVDCGSYTCYFIKRIIEEEVIFKCQYKSDTLFDDTDAYNYRYVLLNEFQKLYEKRCATEIIDIDYV